MRSEIGGLFIIMLFREKHSLEFITPSWILIANLKMQNPHLNVTLRLIFVGKGVNYSVMFVVKNSHCDVPVVVSCISHLKYQSYAWCCTGTKN